MKIFEQTPEGHTKLSKALSNIFTTVATVVFTTLAVMFLNYLRETHAISVKNQDQLGEVKGLQTEMKSELHSDYVLNDVYKADQNTLNVQLQGIRQAQEDIKGSIKELINKK